MLILQNITIMIKERYHKALLYASKCFPLYLANMFQRFLLKWMVQCHKDVYQNLRLRLEYELDKLRIY